MALNTALGFILLLSAVFMALPYGYLSRALFSKYIGGRLMRRSLPLVLLIPPFFGYARLFLQRAKFYNTEYCISLDTAFIVLIVLVLIFFYATTLNKQDHARKEGEKAVTQSEERFRSLIYSLKEGVISYDTNGKILFYNPSFSAMTGYNQKELIGKIVIDTIIPEDSKPALQQRMEERRMGVAEEYESEILHKDSTKVLVSISAVPVLKDGKITSILSTIADITERKKREEDIEAFSASAAHDLNAPLAQVEMGMSYLMKKNKAHLSDEDMEFLEMIVKTTKDMRQLLKDLLLFSRVGTEKVTKVTINMNTMVQEILASMPAPLVNIHIDELPACNGDPGTLKQVWTNLISNAIKYSSKKEAPTVHIGVTTLNEKHAYFVKDNGAGFDMSDSWKLFAPFKRLHSDFDGNGLGLPIVKRIIEKHGGKIWAESAINEGATFYIIV